MSTTRSTTSTLFVATTKETTEEVPRPLASFVMAMNRVDVVDLVDVDPVDVDLVDVDLERAIDKKEIKTRAPDVRLTHRLVHSASFFKTKTSKTLPSPNSIQKSF